MRTARHSNKETVFSSLKRQVWWSLKPAQRNNFAGDTIQTELVQVSSVQSLSRVRLFATPWTAALQASLSITNSQSSPKLKSIESVMPSSHLILGHPLLLLPTIPPSIRVFSNETTLCMRWPKYWRFSFSISLSKEYPGLILVDTTKMGNLGFVLRWISFLNLPRCLTCHTGSLIFFLLIYIAKLALKY